MVPFFVVAFLAMACAQQKATEINMSGKNVDAFDRGRDTLAFPSVIDPDLADGMKLPPGKYLLTDISFYTKPGKTGEEFYSHRTLSERGTLRENDKLEVRANKGRYDIQLNIPLSVVVADNGKPGFFQRHFYWTYLSADDGWKIRTFESAAGIFLNSLIDEKYNRDPKDKTGKKSLKIFSRPDVKLHPNNNEAIPGRAAFVMNGNEMIVYFELSEKNDRKTVIELKYRK